MGPMDNQPAEGSPTPATSAEDLLKSMAQELETLQKTLMLQLQQDVARLQAEKSRLQTEIDHLYQQSASLRSPESSQIPADQQQYLVRQLTLALAEQFQDILLQRLNQQYRPSFDHSPLPTPSIGDQASYQLLQSFESSLRSTLASLQQDLSSYQSSFTQQLNRMQSLEQQGEAILETLVQRLQDKLDTEPEMLPAAAPEAPPLPPPTAPTTPKKQLSQAQLGFLMVILSTIALSVHNVIVRVVGSPSDLFGNFTLGGFVQLNPGNSMFILWLRMLIVVPLLAIASKALYPPVWSDLQKAVSNRDRSPLWTAVASGFALFLSQVLIYIAIGRIGPGVAVTILFMYPILTVPLAWLLFRDKPTTLRLIVMLGVAVGVILAAWPNLASSQNLDLPGVGIALVSGIAFALYLVLIQVAFRKVHPVPVSLIQFFSIFVLCSLSLILPLGFSLTNVTNSTGLLAGGIILGALTLIGYLLNNFAVRFMGAAQASIVSSMGPALTAILAAWVIPGPKTALQLVQWLGIAVVTIAVGALSFEKLQAQTPPQKAKS